VATIDVELKEELKAFVDSEAARSGFSSSAEYVGAVLEALWRESAKANLEAELIRRIDGPAAIEIGPAFWDGLKARLRRPRATGGRA